MSEFRVYVIDALERIVKMRKINCASEQDARQLALRIAHPGYTVELWRDLELVMRESYDLETRTDGAEAA